MGLDMDLIGVRFYPYQEDPPTKDGFRIVNEELEIGYWRKHPNLHGYVVNTFAYGVDRKQKIPLNAGQIENILKAVEADDLPYTQGFFFGESRPEQKEQTIEILKKALVWMGAEEKACIKSCFYEACW